jgi:hypothetical protein
MIADLGKGIAGFLAHFGGICDSKTFWHGRMVDGQTRQQARLKGVLPAEH